MSVGLIGMRRRNGSTGRRGKRVAQRATPIAVTLMAYGGGFVEVTFNQPVLLAGVPKYTLADGSLPTGATLQAANLVKLTYASLGSGAPTITVPFEDPAVRNQAGGYVSPVSMEASA